MMRGVRFLLLFVALLVFWQALSARIDPLFLTMGTLFAAIVAWFGLWLIERTLGPRDDVSAISLWHSLTFSAWMLLRITQSGIWVATVVLHPRRSPRPGVVHFTTGLRSPAARTVLANSISLVPGTITLNVDGGEFIVHAFTPESVEDLVTAETQARIARVFRVPEDTPPAMRWDPVHDELPEDPA